MEKMVAKIHFAQSSKTGQTLMEIVSIIEKYFPSHGFTYDFNESKTLVDVVGGSSPETRTENLKLWAEDQLKSGEKNFMLFPKPGNGESDLTFSEMPILENGQMNWFSELSFQLELPELDPVAIFGAFKELCEIPKAYWGTVDTNKSIRQTIEQFSQNSRIVSGGQLPKLHKLGECGLETPVFLGWINFWSTESRNILQEPWNPVLYQKIFKSQECNNGGIVFQLTEFAPLTIEEHYLGVLALLYKSYPEMYSKTI